MTGGDRPRPGQKLLPRLQCVGYGLGCLVCLEPVTMLRAARRCGPFRPQHLRHGRAFRYELAEDVAPLRQLPVLLVWFQQSELPARDAYRHRVQTGLAVDHHGHRPTQLLGPDPEHGRVDMMQSLRGERRKTALWVSSRSEHRKRRLPRRLRPALADMAEQQRQLMQDRLPVTAGYRHPTHDHGEQ